jgi:putative spermidine/putrescine transport system ATP-binding protein
MTDQDSKTALLLEGVSKHYAGSDKAAVERVDLAIRRGEFVSFLGPSGSGKTTTLNMIAGFINPTSGRILIEGQDIAQLPPHKRNLGMVFQNYALFPHMTVWDNIAFPLVERRLPKKVIAEKVTGALELVHLQGFDRRRPRELSGGQQQRVALARALVFDPPILLMDEPLGALDKNLRGQLQLEIKRVHRELGITFLFVTHDQEEAMALSDTVVVFQDGLIRQVGTPHELYGRPNSRFVAEFLGESNLIDGELARLGEDSWRFSAEEGDVELTRWTPPSELAAGGPCCAMFRPEAVTVLDDDADGNGSSWRAAVEEVVYLGSEERVMLRTSAGRRMVARLRDGSRRARRDVGDKVSLSFHGEDVWILRSGGGE